MMEPSKLNDIFLTLQACFNEILRDGGGNRYKLPHVGKRSIECCDGFLPVCLEVHNILEDIESNDEDSDSSSGDDDDNDVVGEVQAV